jgi:hypothetical protein
MTYGYYAMLFFFSEPQVSGFQIFPLPHFARKVGRARLRCDGTKLFETGEVKGEHGSGVS